MFPSRSSGKAASLIPLVSPYKFEAPWDAFEFAYHVVESESNVVIVSMAWLTREDEQTFTQRQHEPDLDTLMYWISRFEPLINTDAAEETIAIFCNRTGVESDAIYAGTSAVVGFHQGEVKVYGLLSRGDNKLLVVDTNDTPYAKLVSRVRSPSNNSELDSESADAAR